MVFELLASGVSQRRVARLLRVNRKTVAHKLIFLGRSALEQFELENHFREVREFEFDDIETIEHSKCKPISITLAVESKTRRILGFEVASMRAKGLLAKKSIKLYGQRLEERRRKRRALFRRIRPFVADCAVIKSDSNPYYKSDVEEFFPRAKYIQVLGVRGAVTGQGELKKIGFDPIFSLNHTAAMFRANVASLIRKTWCTTKCRARLADRLAIYSKYHNDNLKLHA